MSFREWNDNPTVKRWVIIGLAFVLIMTMLAVCIGGSDQPANAATMTELPSGTSFTLIANPVPVPEALRLTVGQCWRWTYAYESTDGVGRLKYGYGTEHVLCTNKAGGRWATMPTYDVSHWGGYWQYDGKDKYHGALGYSDVNVTTTWKFSFKPVGVPLLTRSPQLRCRYVASNHTGYCSINY